MGADPAADLPRPRDLALLLLASPDLRPRQRARDQQADRAGLALQRELLERVAALDPEPEDFEAALLQVVADLGEPSGPARALALLVRDEWLAACASPAWVAHLLAQATEERPGGRSRG
jgi:hypothetical protein